MNLVSFGSHDEAGYGSASRYVSNKFLLDGDYSLVEVEMSDKQFGWIIGFLGLIWFTLLCMGSVLHEILGKLR